MILATYVNSLREQLAVAADAGGDEARELAARLTAPLESATRLVLLEALSAAADEITRELAPGSVDVRLRAGEPEFVVTPAPSESAYGTGETRQPIGDAPDVEDGGTARLNLRMPEHLKQRIEAAAGAEGLSLNAWLIRAAHAAIENPAGWSGRSSSGGDRFTGWVR